jgi:putative hydrolase of the HAD superfamily
VAFFTEFDAIARVARWFAGICCCNHFEVNSMSDHPPHYRAVLFDFFGTLTRAVRRGPAHARIAESLGCDPDDWAALLDHTFYERATGLLGEPHDVLRQMANRLGGRPRRARLREAFAARIAAVRTDGPLRDDAVGVLRGVRRRGVRTAVVSDSWYELPLFMRQLPVAPLIDAKVYSVHVGRCKPDPALYVAACRQLRVRPQDCLYVGDGGGRELTGAVSVGMTAVRLAEPDLSRHLTFRADYGWGGPAIESLSDVLRLLACCF